jgi:multidrug efflux system membrane fusion protein
VKGTFGVPDSTLSSIHIGQRISVAVEALGGSVTGAVNTISPQGDPKTHLFMIEVYVPNANEKIRPGMLGSVSLTSARGPANHTVAPLSAVVRDPRNSNGFALYRLEDRGGKTYANSRTVTLGDTLGNSIEITSGAAPGERIVVLGAELLKDGQEVRPLP